MPTIRLKRTSEYNNRMRDYKIFIDGQQIGTIANGETKDFPTTVGQHIVTAKVDWCSSPDISVDINDNQTKNLKVGGFRNGQFLMPIGLGLIVLHFMNALGGGGRDKVRSDAGAGSGFSHDDEADGIAFHSFSLQRERASTSLNDVTDTITVMLYER